jgi:hypothetical protein
LIHAIETPIDLVEAFVGAYETPIDLVEAFVVRTKRRSI